MLFEHQLETTKFDNFLNCLTEFVQMVKEVLHLVYRYIGCCN